MQTSQTAAQKYSGYLATVGQLIRRDLRVFKEEFWGKFIDTAILLLTIILVFSYILPSYGLQSGYGPFMLMGAIVGFGFFEIVGRVSLMIADMEGDRLINYTLTLPIPSWLVFGYISVSWAIISLILSSFLFPLGKLILFTQWDWGKIHWFELFLIFILSNLFFGVFALWLSGLLKKMSGLSHLFSRVVMPMYMFGCYMYSWEAIYALSPSAAYAHFLNPLVYIMEGMHAAALGHEGFLPFWFCFFGLAAITALLGWDAIRRLKKRLDCVS